MMLDIRGQSSLTLLSGLKNDSQLKWKRYRVWILHDIVVNESHLLFPAQEQGTGIYEGRKRCARTSHLEVLVQPTGARVRSETFTVAIPGQKFSIGMRIGEPCTGRN